MFEVQLEKLNKAKKEQEKILGEIVDFLNNQMKELLKNGIEFSHDYDWCELSFGTEEGKITVKLQY